MKLTLDQKKQLVIDYNNGNGPSNLELAKMYGVSNTCIRTILIKEKVYKPQRMAIELGHMPNAFEIKTMREQNNVMRTTLKKIINWNIPDSNSGSPIEERDYIMNLAASTLGQVIKKQRACVLGLTSVVRKIV